MVDIAVKTGAAWVCHTQGEQLTDALLAVQISDEDDMEQLDQSEGDGTNRGSQVLLEQTEDGSPCVLTLRCRPCSPTAISHLLVISEARTMEVYSQTGEYCGTVRGKGDNRVQSDDSERGPFYRKQLILERPSPACELKLLSLAGRRSVTVCRVIVGLRQQQPCLPRGPGVDMQQVQCLVDKMGMSLSPGAQNLMDMVHFQQKNQASSLANLLPLLMSGGASSALPPVSSTRPADEAPPAQNGAMPDSSTSSSPRLPVCGFNTGNTASRAQLAEVMSHILEGQGHDQVPSSGPELLPMLQSVCGQVTKLRLDDAAVVAEKMRREEMINGTWELDSAMERRLAEMEGRLKEYVDRRMDALEQKLERALLSALPRITLNEGTAGSTVAGAASPEPSEPTSSAAAMH